MNLLETAELMRSECFKERFEAEYRQLEIRINGLERMLESYQEGTLKFTPKCSYNILHKQLVYMKGYKLVLEERASIENIEL
ncbi:MAG: crAss001_48 related protein [Paraclostridium sp.]